MATHDVVFQPNPSAPISYSSPQGLNQPKMVYDSGDDSISKLASQLNLKLDDATKDILMQYYFNEHSADSAMARSLQFTEEQYSAMVSGLRKAGLNPFLAISGLQGANQMSGQSVNSGYYTSKQNTKTQSGLSATTNVATSIMTVLTLIALKLLIPI